MKTLTLFLSLTTLWLLPSLRADAQSTGSANKANAYRYSHTNGQRTTTEDNFIDIVPPHDYRLYFVRPAGKSSNAPEHQAILRMTAPVEINGCMIITPPEYEGNVRGTTLYIELEKFMVDIDTSARYAHYECDPTPRPVSVDITLDARQLMQDGVKEINFRGTAISDTYTVEASAEKITLLPKSSLIFQPFDLPNRYDPLTHWFYPKNTLILFAPGAESGDGLRQKIIALAATAGMQPLETVLDGFISPLKNPDFVYVVDQSGQIPEELARSPEESSTVFGQITAERDILTPEGPRTHEQPLSVHAKIPGLLE